MEEKELVQSILRGEEKALRRFWREVGPTVYAFITKRIAVKEDAEEILQDSLLASLESLRDFDFRCRLATFVRSIAQHKIIDHYRKKRLKQIFFSQVPEDFLPLISQFLGPEEEFDTREARQRIQIVFQRLRPLYRRILRLKYIEGYSVSEIAQILSVTMKSAESTLFRARMEFVKVYQTV